MNVSFVGMLAYSFATGIILLNVSVEKEYVYRVFRNNAYDLATQTSILVGLLGILVFGSIMAFGVLWLIAYLWSYPNGITWVW